MTWLWLADLIVAVHLAYACFVVFGFLAILLSLVFGWAWTLKLWFRTAHLLCVLFVAAESVLGFSCPLTELEYYLMVRGGKTSHQRSFIGQIADRVLFYEAPEYLFTALYAFLAALALWAYLSLLRSHSSTRDS